MPVYYAVLTTLGLTRLAEAQMSGVPLVFVDVAVGDGGGSAISTDPAVLSGLTALVNETARVSVNNVDISPDDPTVVRVEGLLPAATGGFTIREVGLFNASNEMIAITGTSAIDKPVPADGILVEAYLRVLLKYAAVEAVELTVDPAVVMATRLYVDDMTAGGLWLWENFT